MLTYPSTILVEKKHDAKLSAENNKHGRKDPGLICNSDQLTQFLLAVNWMHSQNETSQNKGPVSFIVK